MRDGCVVATVVAAKDKRITFSPGSGLPGFMHPYVYSFLMFSSEWEDLNEGWDVDFGKR